MQVNICKPSTHRILAAVLGFVLSASANTITYPAPETTGPVGVALPAGFQAFHPPVHENALKAGVPEIAEWTRQSEPGDTMMLTGIQLSSFADRAAGRDTHFYIYAEGLTYPLDGLIQRLDGMKAAIKLPESLPTDQMYLMWPRNHAGYGKPIAINQTESWWIGPDKINRDQTFSVYGRNLVADRDDPVCYLYLQGADQSGAWITSVNANPYKADFILPAGTATGVYTVWAHNGLGRQYGWSKALEITVENGLSWNDDPSTWFDVTGFGAKGDGFSDDAAAIRDAINAADSVDNSTVYFPAGTYLLGSTISDNVSKVRLMGAGKQQTTLSERSGHSGPWLFNIDFTGGEISDMTMECGASISSDNALLRISGSANLSISNVRFSQLPNTSYHLQNNVIEMGGAEHIWFTNCEFIQAWVFLFGDASQIFIDRCHWYGLNDANHLISAKNGRGISIQNSSAQPYDDSDASDGTGWCKGRWVWGGGHKGAIRNWYFGNNATTNMTPRKASDVDQNSGEDFMFESLLTKFVDKPTAATPTHVSFSQSASGQIGNMAIIVDGPGQGQSREIVGYDAGSNRIEVSEPWRVIPDAGSTIMIGRYMNRFALYNNYFDGAARAADPSGANNTASSGIEPYGGCSELVADGNTFHEHRYGIYTQSEARDSVVAGKNTMTPNFFNTFINNTADTCRYLAYVRTRIPHYADRPYDDQTAMLGNIYRNNTGVNLTETPFELETTIDAKFMNMCIYDGNSIENMPDSIIIDRGVLNQIWVGNNFTANSGGNGFMLLDNLPQVFRDNSWSGFDSDYAGQTTGGLLEVPTRTVGVATSGDIPIWNSGTESLNWTASSDSAWLNIGQASGTASAGAGMSVLNVQVDEASVPLDGREGIVTVTSDSGQTQQITVYYEAESALPPPPDGPPSALLVDIVISGPVEVDEGFAAQYTCTASYSDGSTAVIDPVWAENSEFTAIDGFGVLLAGDVGQDEPVTVSASFEGKTTSYDVTINYVPPVLQSISISGPSVLDEEKTAQYDCTAIYSDGSTLDIMPVWSENSSAITISDSGLLTAGDVTADTSVTVTASYNGKSDTQTVVISYVPPVLEGLTIVGPGSVYEETTNQYSCLGSYSDGTTEVVFPSWSENSAHASISDSGLLTAGDVASDQIVTISVSLGGFSASTTVVINYVAPYITGVEISGAAEVNEEDSSSYQCEAIYSDGSRQYVTPEWSVSGQASISTSGLLVTGNVTADQNATITATYADKTDSFSLTIKYVAPTVIGISISGPSYVEEGTAASYSCIASYSDETTKTVVPIWSDNSAYVSINSSGVMTAGDVSSDQTVSLTASFDDFSDTHSVTIGYVAPPVVITGLAITAPLAVEERSVTELSCTAFYSDGSSVVVNPVWTVDASYAAVDSSGQLSMGNIDADGIAVVTATFDGERASRSINVWVVGTQVIYPLSGFDGKTVKARLWDEAAQIWHELGEMDAPKELVIENVTAGQWYWVSIQEYNPETVSWEGVYGSWISM